MSWYWICSCSILNRDWSSSIWFFFHTVLKACLKELHRLFLLLGVRIYSIAESNCLAILLDRSTRLLSSVLVVIACSKASLLFLRFFAMIPRSMWDSGQPWVLFLMCELKANSSQLNWTNWRTLDARATAATASIVQGGDRDASSVRSLAHCYPCRMMRWRWIAWRYLRCKDEAWTA